MKRIIVSLLAITSISLGSAQATVSFNTGSAEFDADLNIINSAATADMAKFKTDMNTAFGVAVSTIDNMLSTDKMAPGEVYLALEIAQTTNKPVADVVTSYKKNKGKGWGVIAQEMGIKPGSDEFHALKGKCKAKKDKTKGNNGNGNGKNK